MEYLQVGADRAGQRIDNFLVSRLKGLPKSLVYRLLRTGQVRVNRGRIKPDYRLQEGDTLRIPPVKVREKSEPSGAKAQETGRRLIDSILFEDRDIVVLNKPAGLAVHAGSGLGYGLIELLRIQPGYENVELAHRLDRETSGCLILARSRPALRRLQQLLRQHAIEKTYLALLRGRLPAKPLIVDSALSRNRLRGGERMVALDEEGKDARTILRAEENYKGAALASVQIETGRTHQIRVHCASIDHPLAGDDKYGDREFNRRMKETGLKRLFLHASELRFTLDTTHVVAAPLPPELKAVLEALKKQQ
ncbi:MAG TPA: RluA family pseudouridine synthase [Gammaproteobacteria bacterium]|nr:RluA family pseudouridine synthase [Gammaproteobacteria bacterium]